MLELILLIAGIAKLVGRPRLRRLRSQDFPRADASKFEEWKIAELQATDTFLWVTWGALFIKLGIAAVLSGASLTADQSLAWLVGVILVWFVGLTVAAIKGSHAKRLKQAAGLIPSGPIQTTRRKALFSSSLAFVGYYFLAVLIMGLVIGALESKWPQLKIRGTWLAAVIMLGLPIISSTYLARKKYFRFEIVAPETHVLCPDCRALVSRHVSRCPKCNCSLVPQ